MQVHVMPFSPNHDILTFLFKVWVDISGARKKMKLNRGKYQQLTGEGLDEQTMHSIQTGICCTDFGVSLYMMGANHPCFSQW